MKQQLDKKLREVTDKEKEILRSGEPNLGFFKNAYFHKETGSFRINGDNFFAGGEKICIEKHLRFADFPLHSHDYIEMVYVYSGAITHVVDHEELTIKQGQILILNQYTSHSIKECGEEDIAINLLIHPSYFQNIKIPRHTKSKIDTFLFSSIFRPKGESHYLYIESDNMLDVNNIMENIANEYYSLDTVRQEMMALYINLLLLIFIKNDKNVHIPELSYHQSELAIRVFEYIRDQYKTARLKELAQQLDMSSEHLSRQIKQQFNKTFTELLTEMRLLHAEQLLLSTQMTIQDIAESVGFSNITYFYQKFNKKHGVTPIVYREKKQTQNINI